MKLKLSFVITIIVGIGFHTSAQSIAGKISGLVKDIQNKALTGATIRLHNEQDTSLEQTAITDQNGVFTFNKLKSGIYTLTVSHVGFKTYPTGRLTIDDTHTAIALPVIILRSSAGQTLKEVVITSKKPMIEQMTDRTIVNVDAMISAAGSNALEALGKSPGVFIDQNGSIELNGQGGVLLLIDDKPTYLSAQDLAAYLRSLPAALLDKIELMSNPPARYDASGSAVINLRLKKNRTAGFNGNLSLGYTQGFYSRSNDALNINYRAKKVNVFANISYSKDASYTSDNGNRYFSDNSGGHTSTIQLNSRYIYSTNSWNARTGMDYFFSPNTTLGFVLNGNTRPRTDLLNYFSGQYNAGGQLDSASRGYTAGNDHWKNWGASLNFQHKFDAGDQQLTASVDEIRYQSNGSQLSPNDVFSTGNVLTDSSAILNQTPSAINIYAAKTDYTLLLKGKMEMSAGLKSSLVNTDNQNNWFNQTGGGFVPDFANTNHFIYRENINAAYISARKEWNRWGVQAGLRMENTEATGHQADNIAVPDSSFHKSYTNLFPSLFLSHKLDSAGNNNLVFSYSIRVRRPNYQQLDPFLFYQNQYTYLAGNPYLNPHYNHILQLKYTYRQYFGFTVAYYYVDHIIYSITQNVNNVFITRPENFGTNNSINFIAYANISPLKGWDLNANFVVYNLTNRGNAFGQVIDENHTTGEVELSNQFRFSHGWSAELNYIFHAPGNGGQSTTGSIWTSSAGIQKKILKGNGTIRLKADDIFHSLSRHQTVLVSGATYIHTSESDTRLLGLSLSYRFGKDANARKRNDKGSAEDEKGRIN
jgi:hypothetical protein